MTGREETWLAAILAQENISNGLHHRFHNDERLTPNG
jgi:hypothetical protein